MAQLEVRKLITPEQAVEITRRKYGFSGSTRTYSVLLDPKHNYHVDVVLVFNCSPFSATLADNRLPSYIFCPYCEKDVRDVTYNPHLSSCPRPTWLYTTSECGQPEYDREYSP